MRRQNHTSIRLLLLACLACLAPVAEGKISAWHANPDADNSESANEDPAANSRKSSIPVTAPSILKRVPSKRQSPSYKAASKQKSNRFSAPTVRKPAFKSREGETEEDVKRRRMWHTTGTFIDGVECMYVHNYHVPVSGKGVAEPYSGKGKGKGGSSEYYSGKGKGGSSEYYYSSKGKGGSGSGSKKSSGSKRRNLSSAYGGYENGWRKDMDGGESIREQEDTDDEWRSEVEDDDWRNEDDKKSQKDTTSKNAKSQRKMRRYVPNHYYPPSDYTYYTPYGNGEPYHGAGGYHGTTGYICRFIDIYDDDFSFIESFTFSFIDSFSFSFIDSFSFSIVESFTFSIVESFTFSVVDRYVPHRHSSSFILFCSSFSLTCIPFSISFQ